MEAQMSKKNYNVFSNEPLKKHIKESKEKQAIFAEMGAGHKKYPVYLSLRPDEEAIVRFLTVEPLKFWQHRVYDDQIRGGQGGWRVLTCTRRDDCPLCLADNRPSFKVAWQVVHLDNRDSDGNVTPRVKLWVQGIRFAEMFEKKTKRFDVTKEDVILERIGEGTSTTYTIEKTGDKGKVRFDKDELTDLEDYFGLDDAKYEAMLRLGVSNSDNSEEDDEDEEDYKPKPRKKSKGKSRRHPAEEDEDDEDVPF